VGSGIGFRPDAALSSTTARRVPAPQVVATVAATPAVPAPVAVATAAPEDVLLEFAPPQQPAQPAPQPKPPKPEFDLDLLQAVLALTGVNKVNGQAFFEGGRPSYKVQATGQSKPITPAAVTKIMKHINARAGERGIAPKQMVDEWRAAVDLERGKFLLGTGGVGAPVNTRRAAAKAKLPPANVINATKNNSTGGRRERARLYVTTDDWNKPISSRDAESVARKYVAMGLDTGGARRNRSRV
jgi:hypothetical protein